jgi:hypothetical protein
VSPAPLIQIKPSRRCSPLILPLQGSSHNVTQDVLAIAAAREFGAYPFDMMMESDGPSCSSSVPAITPRSPDSSITEIGKGLGISDQCIDHAESLYLHFISTDKYRERLDSSRDCIAATCVYLAEQASQTGPSCSIDSISSAFKCSVSDITRLKSKLHTLKHTSEFARIEPVPVFYAYVCDFGLSKVSFSCSHILPCLMKAFFSSAIWTLGFNRQRCERILVVHGS